LSSIIWRENASKSGFAVSERTTAVSRSVSATASARFRAAKPGASAAGATSSTSCATLSARPQSDVTVADAPGRSDAADAENAQGVFETLTSSAAASAAADAAAAKPSGARSVVSLPKTTSGSTIMGRSAAGSPPAGSANANAKFPSSIAWTWAESAVDAESLKYGSSQAAFSTTAESSARPQW